MTADLYDAGYKDQVNVDFSATAIETMKKRYEELGLEWKAMDVRNMDFEDEVFDVAIDKVGLYELGGGPV